MAGFRLDSIKTEPLDVSQRLCEDKGSQKVEPSEDGTSDVPGTLPLGWRKIVTQRKTGRTAGRHDVYFISPEGTKFRSKIALEKYLNTNYAEIKLEDFDFSVPSQQRHGTSIIAEFIKMDNGERSATHCSVPEEHKGPTKDHPEDPGGDHPEDPGGDHPEDPGGDHPEDPGGDHPEDPGGDHLEDHVDDTQNVEDPFIEDEYNRTMTMKYVGRKRVRSHRKGSERALKTVTRIKRPRKYSSLKTEMLIKTRKCKRRNILKEPRKEASSETDSLSEYRLQNPHREVDCKVEDPTDLCVPVAVKEEAEDWTSTPPLEQQPEAESDQKSSNSSDVPVAVKEEAEDWTSTPPLEQQPEAENDQKSSNSSDENLLTSSGKTKDSMTRSQVEKRKTSPYFSKKATRDVQTPKTQWCSVKDTYRRDLQQIKKEQRSGSRASRMENHFDKEEQDPSHVDPDEAEARSISSQLCPLNPMVSDSTNSATAVEATQGAESGVDGLLTSHPSGRPRPLPSYSPSNQSHHPQVENQLLLALNTFIEQRQAEQSPMYHFAVSLVPLLDKVSEDRLVDMRRDILNLITSYLSSDALPPHLYVHPYNLPSCYRQLYSPAPPYPVHASSPPPVQQDLPDQSASEDQIPPRCSTPLTPTASHRPSRHSLFEEQSSSTKKTGQTGLPCTLF